MKAEKRYIFDEKTLKENERETIDNDYYYSTVK